MSSTTLVTGGTGLLGAQVVPLLRQAGHKVRVLSLRRPGAGRRREYVAVDLMTGDGLDEALGGVRTVLHLAGGPKGDDVSTRTWSRPPSARAPWTTWCSSRSSARYRADRLLRLARRRPSGSWLASGIPYTILRAAQFHDLALKTVRAMAGAILPAPGGVRWQPVASREVAGPLAELTLGNPAAASSTWPDRASTPWRNSSVITWPPWASTGCGSRSASRARLARPTGRGPTSPWARPPAATPGSSS